MGVTGVEGVFRRCCEETLSVMRTNKEALLTIIEVLIHFSQEEKTLIFNTCSFSPLNMENEFRAGFHP